MARVTKCCEFRIFALVHAVSTLLIIQLVGGRTPKVNQDPGFRQPMMQRSALKTAPSRVSGKSAAWRSMQESAPFNQQAANQASQTRGGRRGGPITAGRKFQGTSVQARSGLAASKEGILHPPRQSSLPVLPKQQRDRNRPLPLPHLRAIASQTVSRADISACLPKVEHELPSYVVRLCIVHSTLLTCARCSGLGNLRRTTSLSDSPLMIDLQLFSRRLWMQRYPAPAAVLPHH